MQKLVGAIVLLFAVACVFGCKTGGTGGGSNNCPTEVPLPTLNESCRDNCNASLQACGDTEFFASYASVLECTNECVGLAEDFASDVENFEGCIEAQVAFIECCTCENQCGGIPDCDPQFDDAAGACGGLFGGCPSIFFGE